MRVNGESRGQEMPIKKGCLKKKCQKSWQRITGLIS